jgi:hypothetical protein
MGVKLMDLTDEDKKDLGVKSGMKVAEVVEGGPAAKAGLKVDDVITSVDGRSVDSMQELAPIMAAAGVGASVKLETLSGGNKKTVTVVLAPHPADAEPPKEQGKGDEDLRERVKKFLEKKETPQDGPKPKAKGKAPAPKDDEGGGIDELLAFDEETFDQFKEMFEKFGVDPEQFFEKGKDGKYRLNDQMKEMFKNFNLDKFKNLFPSRKAPDPARGRVGAAQGGAEKADPGRRALAGPPARGAAGRAARAADGGEGLLVTQVMAAARPSRRAEEERHPDEDRRPGGEGRVAREVHGLRSPARKPR